MAPSILYRNGIGSGAYHHADKFSVVRTRHIPYYIRSGTCMPNNKNADWITSPTFLDS